MLERVGITGLRTLEFFFVCSGQCLAKVFEPMIFCISKVVRGLETFCSVCGVIRRVVVGVLEGPGGHGIIGPPTGG